MRPYIPPRLRKPLGIAVAGVVFAAAWLVRGGPLWWVSILAVILAAVRAVTWYRMGGKDTDEGALAGSRADERQQLLSLRSRALACNLAATAAFIGLTVAIAVKAAWWWPFLVILAVAGFGYLLGLSTYGVAEQDPADDDEDAGRQARPPVRQ
jgi:membrane protein implicated in regulation of membrane protease activity